MVPGTSLLARHASAAGRAYGGADEIPCDTRGAALSSPAAANEGAAAVGRPEDMCSPYGVESPSSATDPPAY